jgi:crotonobetainyl-CoA:carnitine CoA-transferase CaiB-like acyl-CoA transferase
MLTNEQILARNAIVPVEIAPGVEIPLPNGMIEIDGNRAGVPVPPPRPGEHQQILSRQPTRKASAPPGTPAVFNPPFTGLRVLDLGVIVIGAETGRLLADQGADVIKVETSEFPDGGRQARGGAKISVAFACGHRNKRSLGINLRKPEGRDLFLELAKQADVILSNSKPGTLESLGLDYDTVSTLNPQVIMVENSAFGRSGPWGGRMGYGPLVRASAGLTAQWCYEGDPGSNSDTITVYPDHVAGRIGAIGMIALLIRRLRIGRGGSATSSMLELMLGHLAPQIAAKALFGPEGGSVPDAPWGVFPCMGDDDWCVVTVRGDADWASLCRVMGRPDLAADPALSNAAGRQARRGQVDQAVAEWLAERDPRVAMEELQAAGVPAGAMLRVAEMPEFDYFVERRFLAKARHPLIADPFYMENAPVRSERIPDPPMDPAPTIGEHTADVLREWLGLPPEEITRLVDAGVLDLPTPSV